MRLRGLREIDYITVTLADGAHTGVVTKLLPGIDGEGDHFTLTLREWSRVIAFDEVQAIQVHERYD